jgi:hypothetical protein
MTCSTDARRRTRAGSPWTSQALVLASILAGAAGVAGAVDEDDADAEKKTLPELAVVLPAMPKSENLLEFQASAASTSHYFIDAASISIEKDGTVRYTLVVKGSGGGENISYEAIRCDTLEQKAFAFGRRNGTWANAKESAWRRIQYKTGNLQYAVLYTDYFCPDGKPIRSPKDAITAFKYGVPYGQPPRTRN